MAGVLVIGATGYIGRAVAQAARRDGFTVYAQTRSHDKTTSLATDELIPIVCDPTDAGALRPTIAECEFVIDCTAKYENPRAIPEAYVEAIKACGGSKHLIFTSGCLDQGDHPGEVVSEDVVDCPDHITWRLDLQNSLLADADFDCTVLRPAFVYGRSGGDFARILFRKPEGDKLQLSGPTKRWSWVHIDDVADAYIRVMHRRSVAAGRVYNLGEPFGPMYEEIRLAGARLAGFRGSEVEVVEAEGMEAFWNYTMVVSSKRAHDELGWSSKHTGIMADLSLYYEAYKAST